MGNNICLGDNSLQAPDVLSRLPSEAAAPTSAENQRKQQSQAPPTWKKLKQKSRWAHDHSKLHLEQTLSGCQQPPGTRWCPQLHFQVPEFQLLAENPTKLAPAGLLRLASVQTANGINPLPLSNGWGTIFEWTATASRHQMVSPGHARRPSSAFQ